MIKIEGLTKRYGNDLIFDKANFIFPDKGLICLFGASGCGKSTLLNLLAGFDTDYEGKITTYNLILNKMSDEEMCNYRLNHIGFIFQNYHLLNGYTVLENVLFACSLNSLSEEENVSKARLILEKLGLSSKEHEKVENLSGGQKQRVAIARALVKNAKIILADEPTGALDRANTNELMSILKEIANDILVIVITHDHNICTYANRIISIKDKQITYDSNGNFNDVDSKEKLQGEISTNKSFIKQAFKNFKVHLRQYMAISLAIVIGIFCFMFSMSSSNIVGKSILDFKEKNIAFNNGYIKLKDNSEKVIKTLESNEQIENIYKQFILKNISLSINEYSITIKEKLPMPKATVNMSYGSMPKIKKGEIVLSPSLAKKFAKDIKDLIGKNINFKYMDKEYSLIVSGIFNVSYDDFFISSDLEQELFQSVKDETAYSISYDVKEFEDVVPIHKMLVDKGIENIMADKEVSILQDTFHNLKRLFLVISILILVISLFIGTVLLTKFQRSRYREIGLLTALGFSKKNIRNMIIMENIFLSIITTFLYLVLLIFTYLIGLIFGFSLIITFLQLFLSIIASAVIVILISMVVSYKLINIDVAVALKN